jgi:hypothetical protein
MKTALIGSRTFTDYTFFCKKLQDFTITEIISGGAKGADTLAEAYALQFQIPLTVILPNWNKHGKSAGFVRNKKIVEKAEIVIAFWDGYSKGTEHSINVARAMKKVVHIILI